MTALIKSLEKYIRTVASSFRHPGLCRHYTIDDLCQEAKLSMLVAYSNGRVPSEKKDAISFLKKVAINRMLDLHRTYSIRKKGQLELPLSNYQNDDEGETILEFEDTRRVDIETLIILKESVSALANSASQQEKDVVGVFLSAMEEGEDEPTGKQISAITGHSPATVSRVLARIRNRQTFVGLSF